MKNICKVVAIVLLMLSVLMGMIVGIKGESLLMFLAMVLSGFISFLTLFALGEILEYVETINCNVIEIHRRIRKEKIDEVTLKSSSTKESGSYDVRSVCESKDENWRCAKCGYVNDKIAQFCKSCGEYK